MEQKIVGSLNTKRDKKDRRSLSRSPSDDAAACQRACPCNCSIIGIPTRLLRDIRQTGEMRKKVNTVMLASFASAAATSALLAGVMLGFAQAAQTSSLNKTCISLVDLGVEGVQSVKLATLILEGAKEVQKEVRASASTLTRYFLFRKASFPLSKNPPSNHEGKTYLDAIQMILQTQETLRTSRKHLVDFSTAANRLRLDNIARCPRCASGRGLITGLCEDKGKQSLGSEVQMQMESILRRHDAIGKAVDDMMDGLITEVERPDDDSLGVPVDGISVENAMRTDTL